MFILYVTTINFRIYIILNSVYYFCVSHNCINIIVYEKRLWKQ